MEKRERFEKILREENQKTNLISRRSFESTLNYLWALSEFILKTLEPFSSLVDIGSGAGFPGLAIKIMAPEKRVILVEPRRKKAEFLRRVQRELNLENLEILEGDFLLFHKKYCHERIDFLVSMGVKKKESFIREDCGNIVKGYCFVTGKEEVERLLNHRKVKKYNTEVKKIPGRDRLFLLIIRKPWEKF